MRFFPQKTGNADAFYEPNSLGGAVQGERFREPPLKISGDAQRYNHRDGNDDYRRAAALFNLFDASQKAGSISTWPRQCSAYRTRSRSGSSLISARSTPITRRGFGASRTT